MKIEAMRYSETSVNFCRTASRHIPEDTGRVTIPVVWVAREVNGERWPEVPRQ
jgi:hypothetical protein